MVDRLAVVYLTVAESLAQDEKRDTKKEEEKKKDKEGQIERFWFLFEFEGLLR